MAKSTDIRDNGSESTGNECSRSEATRQRLIEAALRLFSRQGFEAVSTRSLASAAKVNQAAIPYHFQSKEGLYHAVAHRIVEMVRPTLFPVIETVREHHRDGVRDLHLAREDVAVLVLALMRKIVSEPQRYEIGYFMLREQMQPSAALDILYDGLVLPLHQLLARLVAALRDQEESDPDVIIEVQALYGEAIGFGAHRTTLIRRLGIERLDDHHLERISRVVHAMVLRQFPVAGSPEA